MAGLSLVNILKLTSVYFRLVRDKQYGHYVNTRDQ